MPAYSVQFLFFQLEEVFGPVLAINDEPNERVI